MSTPSSPSASTTTSGSTSTSPSTPPSVTISESSTLTPSSSESSSSSSSPTKTPPTSSRKMSSPIHLNYQQQLNQIYSDMNPRAVAAFMKIELDPDARSVREHPDFLTKAAEHIQDYVNMCTMVGIEVDDALFEKLKDAAANTMLRQLHTTTITPQPQPQQPSSKQS